MRGSVYHEKRILPPSKKHPTGRVRYYLFSEVNGVRESHGGFNTFRDVQAAARVLNGKLADGTFGEPEKENPFYIDYYDRWWVSKKPTLRASAIRAYESSFRLYVLPLFKRKRIVAITPRDVQNLVDSLNHLSPEYVKTIYAHFRTCMRSAEDEGLIKITPCRGIHLRKKERKVKKYLGPTDTWGLIMEAKPPYDILFSVLALSGIRIGECQALRVINIDFKAGKIRIEQSWDNNTRVLHEPKTEASIRAVEMIDCLATILAKYLEEKGISSSDAYIFPSPESESRPVAHPTVSEQFHKARQRKGLPHCTIHSLRHSFASVMLGAGVAIPTISRNLGHANPVITMQVYAHEISELIGPALQRADEIFQAARDALETK